MMVAVLNLVISICIILYYKTTVFMFFLAVFRKVLVRPVLVTVKSCLSETLK